MENYESKKLLLLRILDILTKYTDCEHKVKQCEIIKILKSEFGIECERKAVARNIDFLIEAGYDIVSERTGVYLAIRKFEPGELRFLIDSVLTNRNISTNYSRNLIKKLVAEGGKHFKNYTTHITNLDDWQKENNPNYFLNIELLSEAIEKQVKITFYNCYYNAKKHLVKYGGKHLVSPYQLLLKNGHYYVMCNYENYDNMIFCRLDRLSDITLTSTQIRERNTVFGYKNNECLATINNRLPYPFDGEAEKIELVVGEPIVNDIVDWFGFNFSAKELADGNVQISLTASIKAMRFWILQFGKYVKVLSPQNLVEQIKQDIIEMQKIYN